VSSHYGVPFRDLSARGKDQTRLYWLLVLEGPLTMPDLRLRTNWTTKRTNDTLYRLRQNGCVRLTEKGQLLRELVRQMGSDYRGSGI
jgi:hypothetical protein